MRPRRIFARANVSTDERGMNKTEAAYAQHLEWSRTVGKIHQWWFEAAKLRIGPPGGRCWYTPDFMVVAENGEVEFHESKGFKRRANGEPGCYIEEDARVKIKAAAALYPYHFVLVYKLPLKDGGGWQREDV